MTEPLLSVEELCVQYVTPQGARTVVDHVSFSINEGEFLGLCGESGSGKSTLVHAVMRTLGSPGIITGGHAWYRGRDLFAMDEAELRRLRWTDISIVFQSAMDSLNPVLTVERQMLDTLLAHGPEGQSGATTRIHELLDMVGVEGRFAQAFPHELSGGMRQRVGIALALALNPRLVIMDEPTTALDVIVERSILETVLKLKAELGFAVIFITHDLQRLIEVSDTMGVMREGMLLELAPTHEVVSQPKHEYTRHLLASYPRLFDEK